MRIEGAGGRQSERCCEELTYSERKFAGQQLKTHTRIRRQVGSKSHTGRSEHHHKRGPGRGEGRAAYSNKLSLYRTAINGIYLVLVTRLRAGPATAFYCPPQSKYAALSQRRRVFERDVCAPGY
ncbi:hypothetical protein EVAR_18192_1 [Eumeta japonica]|uniref:Uncharacterized protein n=1 Tax=Eumeta variegata TaxID=151549 RepID=A0A4C1UV63_EUMVA|nr:hypothetical protein EVAR_18192_1 [Eumeta japonica]